MAKLNLVEEESSSSDDETTSGSDSGSGSEPESPPKRPLFSESSTKKPEPVSAQSTRNKPNSSLKPCSSKPDPNNSNPARPIKPKKQPSPPSSADETEDEDEDSIKPISSKPEKSNPARPNKPKDDEAEGSKKPISPNPARPNKPKPSADVTTGAKRPAEQSSEANKPKKPKQKDENLAKDSPSGDVKRQLFQRLFDENDEIAILEGLRDFWSEYESDPLLNLNSFRDFVSKKLHVEDVSRAQLQNKIKRLKKRYDNIVEKERNSKKKRTFSKPHEERVHELSKLVWGDEKNNERGNLEAKVKAERVENGNVGENVRDNVCLNEVKGDKKSVEINDSVVDDLVSCDGVVALEDWVKKNSGLIGAEKRDEVAKKLRSLKLDEMDLALKRIGLIHELARIVREAMGNSES